MKTLLLTRWYGYGLLAVLLLIVVHTPLTVLAGSVLPESGVIIKAWKEIALTGLAIAVVILLTKRRMWQSVLSQRIIQLCLVYIGLHMLLAILLPTSLLQTVAGLMIDLRFVAFFMLFYVAACLLPTMLRHALFVTAIGAVLVLGFGLLQITLLPDDILRLIGYGEETARPFTTIDRNPDFVRIHSTLRGPNPLGAVAVVYLALALAYLRYIWRTRASVRYRWWGSIGTILASLMVVFASYSRSAYLAAGIVVAGFAAMLWRPTKKSLTMVAIGAVVVTAAGIGLQTTDWYSNVVLHEDPESPVVSKSNEGHVDSLVDGLGRAAVQPLGAGIGSTGSASLYDESTANDRIIENYYLFVAHESGWLGLVVFVVIFGLIMQRLWRLKQEWPARGLFWSGLGLAAIGLLLPVWTDDTVSLIWWGLAGVIIGSGIMNDDATGSRQQKTARTTSVRR